MIAAWVRQSIHLFVAVGLSIAGGALTATAETFRIPGTDYDMTLDAGAQPPNFSFSEPLLSAIAVWLSKEFDLPAIHRYPDIKLVSSGAIAALRYNRLLPHAPYDAARDAGPAIPQTDETVAIYVDDTQTIYLTEGWTGQTPADLSILVHEMVHHFQNKLGLKHECPQEREMLAYQAQDRWLRLFGRSVETDFDLDGFSLLVKTRCFH
jgi:hypothetical protein